MQALISPPELAPEPEKPQKTRKTYSPPIILHELELETCAGSPIGPSPDSLLDPLGLTGLDG
jgi:hypothetical protein